MQDRDELSRMIDQAMAFYVDAEPLAGLEERVLNRVRVLEADLPWRLAWAFAAVVVVAAIVMWMPLHPAARSSEVAGVVADVPVPTSPPPEKPMRSRAPRHRFLPKLEQFPRPIPLTAEERALAAFVARQPVEAQQVCADLQRSMHEPIDIQPIQIAPLQSDGAQ